MEPPRTDAPQSTVALTRDDVKTLSSDTRVDILKRLGERRMTVTELAAAQQLSKATVLEHLEKLSGAGFIRRLEDEKRVWVYYELADKGRRIVFQSSTRFVLLLSGAGVAAVGGAASFVVWALSNAPSSGSGFAREGDSAGAPSESPSAGESPPPAAPASPSPVPEQEPSAASSMGSGGGALRVALGLALVLSASALAWVALRSRKRAMATLAAL